MKFKAPAIGTDAGAVVGAIAGHTVWGAAIGAAAGTAGMKKTRRPNTRKATRPASRASRRVRRTHLKNASDGHMWCCRPTQTAHIPKRMLRVFGGRRFANVHDLLFLRSVLV
jgi:hypothetical protein